MKGQFPFIKANGNTPRERRERVDSNDLYEEVLTQAAVQARRYLRTIRERHVGVLPEAIEGLSALGGPLPARGENPLAILKLLDDAAVRRPRWRVWVGIFSEGNCGALPASVAADWLADAWDQNACLYDISPVAAHLEDVVLSWILDLLGLPPNCGGAFVTGTQMADVTALAAARSSVLRNTGWDVERDGLFSAPPVTVIVGEEVHATMLKALALLGFGRGHVHIVPADSQGRMKPSLLPGVAGPAIVCVQAGNVNTGACDPVGEICDLAHEMGAWVHVDGAFGLWAAVSHHRKHLVEGVAQADSWATDAHKWLNVPQDSGIAIVKDAEALGRSMSIAASYYPPDADSKRQPMQLGPESSRRARAVEIWAALRSLGKQGVVDLIDRCCQHATTFAKALGAGGCEVLNDVVLNQVLVSFGDDGINTRVIDAVQADGTCWCGGTVWKGRKAMRISVSSWATTDLDVSRSVAAILKVAADQSSSSVTFERAFTEGQIDSR